MLIISVDASPLTPLPTIPPTALPQNISLAKPTIGFVFLVLTLPLYNLTAFAGRFDELQDFRRRESDIFAQFYTLKKKKMSVVLGVGRLAALV